MPRKARQRSSVNLYHIILRGINKQIIFKDEYDYKYFISLLQKQREDYNYKVYAYCIMSNHIHMLIEDTDNALNQIMKSIEVKFVRWYNNKYERCGNLFQERFKSEPIDNESYLLTVFRYIHQNPIKARLETRIGEYPWSSYKAYSGEMNLSVDADWCRAYFKTTEECVAFLKEQSFDNCMEYYAEKRIPDEEAIKIINGLVGCHAPMELLRYDLIERDKYLKILGKSGISMRQLSRLTGVPRAAIAKAKGDR